MNEANPFVISQFTNPSGEIVFRVAGWLEGKRVRQNYSTRAEADAQRQLLQVQRLQGETGIRTAVTRLTDEQLQEAEAAFLRLKGAPQSLMAYLDCGLANYRGPQQQKPFADALADYLATKVAAEERTLLSMRQLRSIRNELNAFQRRFSKGALAEFTPALLMPYLERGNPSLKTYNNRRGLLSTFFKFALQKDWIATNPIEKTPHHRINHCRGSAETITAEKAARLMSYVEGYENGEMVSRVTPKPATRGQGEGSKPATLSETVGVIVV
jgi:hypothetical protein